VPSLDPRVEAIRGVLIKLRTRVGLTADRLRLSGAGAVLLVDLAEPLVRTSGSDDEVRESIVGSIRRLAGRLDPTEMLIVDAALALGLMRDVDIDVNADLLYSADLTRRRERLIESWLALHDALQVVEPPLPPSVSTLRTSLEPRAMGLLAEACVSATTVNIGSAESQSMVQSLAHVGGEAPFGGVVVIGGAVMDTICTVERIPEMNRSAQADQLHRHPGGKGLNQAIAVARLGLGVDLIAAVGADADSAQVLGYLERSGLRTGYIKQVSHQPCPSTVVILTTTGGSMMIGSKNVSPAAADINRDETFQLLRRAKAILMTFEISVDAALALLEMVDRLDTPRPLLFVHPSPPAKGFEVLYGHFKAVDYLIGTPWELRALLPGEGAEVPMEDVAARLLSLGVENVCAIENFSCTFWSPGRHLQVSKLSTALRELPAARDAFSAALAYRIINRSEDSPALGDLQWAMVATTAVQSLGDMPSTMPTLGQIEQAMRLHRFEKEENEN